MAKFLFLHFPLSLTFVEDVLVKASRLTSPGEMFRLFLCRTKVGVWCSDCVLVRPLSFLMLGATFIKKPRFRICSAFCCSPCTLSSVLKNKLILRKFCGWFWWLAQDLSLKAFNDYSLKSLVNFSWYSKSFNLYIHSPTDTIDY